MQLNRQSQLFLFSKRGVFSFWLVASPHPRRWKHQRVLLGARWLVCAKSEEKNVGRKRRSQRFIFEFSNAHSFNGDMLLWPGASPQGKMWKKAGKDGKMKKT